MAKALSVDLANVTPAGRCEVWGERGERSAMASTVQGEWHGCAEQAGGSPLRSDRSL